MQLGMQTVYAALADENSTSKLFFCSVCSSQSGNRDAEAAIPREMGQPRKTTESLNQDGFVGIVSSREIQTRTETKQLGHTFSGCNGATVSNCVEWVYNVGTWYKNERTDGRTRYQQQQSMGHEIFFSNSRMDKERQAGEAAGSCSWLIVTVVAGRRARGSSSSAPEMGRRRENRVCQSETKR
jgi:hypothetical protein